MKLAHCSLLSVLLLSSCAHAAVKNPVSATSAPKKQVQTAASPSKFAVYINDKDARNAYIPSGWMGDTGDLRVSSSWSNGAYEGSCVKVDYNAKMSKNAGWVGIFWQYPSNNWGIKPGRNLSGVSRLTFWAKGQKGGEILSEFKVGGIQGEVPDSSETKIGPVTLTNEWKKYTIDLAGQDMSNIAGGFCFAASKDDNPEGFTIYLDQIVFE
jgi:hypothetical protein